MRGASMVGDLGGIKRYVNDYVARQIQPLQEQLEHANGDVAALRRDLGDALLRIELQQAALSGTLNMLARRTRRSDRVRCLFLVHYMEAWDSIADVIAEMRAAEDFEPVVASIPRRLPGSPGFQDEAVTHERLSALGVPHLRLDGEDSYFALETIKHLDPDLIFRQSQWDPDYPPGFSTPSLSFARLALIPYETMNIVENVALPGDVRDTATDSSYHRGCWAVFCTNEFMRARAEANSPATNARQFVVTGHPKVQSLRAQMAAWGEGASPKEGFVVAWSAHHSIDDDWTRFGLFPTMAEQMVAWAESSPEITFVFSPHPSLTTRLDAATPPLTRPMVDSFRARWAALPNTELFTGGQTGQYGGLFARADVMVTDGLSMLVEFQLAGKPLIFVERDGHRPFTELGRLASRGFHTVASTGEARSLVERFAAGEPDPLAGAQSEVVTQLFGEHDASREIVEHIRRTWWIDVERVE